VSDYETTQARRNTIVGVFVLLAIVSLAWLIYKFGDLPTKVSEIGSFRVFVQFPTAPGVQKDTPVRFCGYQIGRVTKVKPPERLREIRNGKRIGPEYHQTVVIMSIDKKYVNIPSNVEVKMMTRGLGSSFIEMKVDPVKLPEPQDPNRPETAFLYDGIWLQGSTGVTSEFFPAESQKKLDELVTGLNQLIKNANDVIGDPNNKSNIALTLANLADASGEAVDSFKEFRRFSSSAVAMSEELSKTVASLRVILEKVNSGQGTAARVVNDGRLYEQLLESTRQLQLLLQDMKDLVAKLRAEGVKIKL